MAVAAPGGWHSTTSDTFDVTLGRKRVGKVKAIGLSQTALLSGSVFGDADGDGLRGEGEAGLRRWRVYLDLDGDGTWEKTEPTARTDKQGNWVLKAVPPGDYTVRVVPKPGFTPTAPAAGFFAVTLAAADASDTDNAFGEQPAPAPAP